MQATAERLEPLTIENSLKTQFVPKYNAPALPSSIDLGYEFIEKPSEITNNNPPPKPPNLDKPKIQSTRNEELSEFSTSTVAFKLAEVNRELNQIHPKSISVGEKLFKAADHDGLKIEIKTKVAEIKELMNKYEFNKAFKIEFGLLIDKYNNKQKPLWVIAKEMENLTKAFEQYAFILNKIEVESIYFDNKFKTKIESVLKDISVRNQFNTLELIIDLKNQIEEYSQKPYYKIKKQIVSSFKVENLSDEGFQKILKLEILLEDERINDNNSEQVYTIIGVGLEKILKLEIKGKTEVIETSQPKSLELITSKEQSKWGNLIHGARKLFKPVVNLAGAGAIAAGIGAFVNPDFITNPSNLAVTPAEVKMATESLREQVLENGQTAQALESYPNGITNTKQFVTQKVELTPPNLERAPKETQQFIEAELAKINNLSNPDKQQILNILKAAKGENFELNERLDRVYVNVQSKLDYNTFIMKLAGSGLISISGLSLLLAARKPKRAPEIANL
jgi:hypothetical protein